MVRTQIYLTAVERKKLAAMAKSTGKKQSQLIREAIDKLILEASGSSRADVLKRAAGMWKNRKDLPDPKTLRKSWDRG